MYPKLNIAINAAKEAGNLIIKFYKTPDDVKIEYKNSNDFVTNVDKLAEEIIINTIRKSYPQHTIFCEESGEHKGDNRDIQWIIDPLDGTTNFVKHLPHFAVSIAARIKKCTEISVIYDPIRNDLFTAIRGKGARLNGYRLQSSCAKDLTGTVLATGFPFKAKQHTDAYMNILRKLYNKCADFRRTGSAALDLAYVASGSVDGYFEIGLKLWDFAAGELIAQEANAIVCDFIGSQNYMLTGNIVAGNPNIVKLMLADMYDELDEALKY